MSEYYQLTQDERYQIWSLKKAGFGVRAIAVEVDRHHSTT